MWRARARVCGRRAMAKPETLAARHFLISARAAARDAREGGFADDYNGKDEKIARWARRDEEH